MQRAGAISAFGEAVGKVTSEIWGQAPAKDPGLVQPLGVIAVNSEVLLTDKDYADISRALRRPGGMTEKEIKDLLEYYKLDPTDEAVSSLTRRV